MTALRKILIEEEPVVATKVGPAPTAKLYVVTGNAPAEANAAAPEAAGGTLKNIALFFAAPFIGLAYIVALPLVGLALLAMMVVRAAIKIAAVKTIAMFIAAPFIGLVAVVLFPFIGLAMLTWMGGRAMVAARV